ncbi:MAG: CerR family C-terminal domain-containing protein [Deltaproteobacteria bacterium]|nr:CerR family C-terminal domain-containing protein [Deltaproteobacteria bacterium]
MSRPRATSDRLLTAATDLFARRGFHGTSIREIAERAGANVAAGHYHYGSKKGLYLQVLRHQFARVRATLDRDGPLAASRVLRTLPRRELVALLVRRIEAMVTILLAPPLQPHGALMLREMCDPTDAMPIIVREFIRPQSSEMAAIVACLVPGAGRTVVERSVRSIVGQVLFYRFTMPAVLLMLGRPTYSRHFTRQIATHIVEFSLGGLTRVGRPGTVTRRPRPYVGRTRERSRRAPARRRRARAR